MAARTGQLQRGMHVLHMGEGTLHVHALGWAEMPWGSSSHVPSAGSKKSGVLQEAMANLLVRNLDAVDRLPICIHMRLLIGQQKEKSQVFFPLLRRNEFEYCHLCDN